jgi:tetratricopeptide (TPR) repeat protein
MNRRDRRASTKQVKTGLVNPAAGPVAALYDTALRHMREERYLDAQLCCRQALTIAPDHADILHLMGLLSFHVKQYDMAVEWISRAIRQEPKPTYLTSLGTTLSNMGRYDEALKAFDKAVQIKPEDADLWRNLGNVLVDVKRPAEAILAFQHAFKLNPRHWDAAFKAGHLLYQSQRYQEALDCFVLCDKLQPKHALTLQMRALMLQNLKRFEEALACDMQSLALDPDNAETCNNTGNVLQMLGRNEEALVWFDRTLELRPNLVDTLNNKALSLIELRRFDEVHATYARSQAISPGNAATDWNLALFQLLTGDFKPGWAGREARWDALNVPAPKLSKPMWLGEQPLAGKTILLHSDEGLGDAIQFARYAPIVAARGARVILAVEDALHPLMSGLAGVAQCIPRSASALPPFDLHCPLSSLPLAFGTTLESIPAETSYLAAAADRVQAWETRLGAHDRLRVGLVWSGNPAHKNDHNRSMPLQMLASVLATEATFISLQKDPRPEDRAFFAEHSGIVDLTAHLTDFAETAALISCLDLVITVDTSVAHLAGAIGRPTWILLPYTPDYRWLLNRDDNPWYPTVRLFRQSEKRSYAEVLEQARDELRALIAAF